MQEVMLVLGTKMPVSVITWRFSLNFASVSLLQIFLHICSYLDARCIAHSLSLVCKRFYEILSDTTLWKLRITKRWGSKYPPVPGMYLCSVAAHCLDVW